MFFLLVAVVMNVYLLIIIPKGFFPNVDEGRIIGNIRGDQSISYQSMVKKFIQFADIIRADPAVAELAGSIGAGAGGRGGGATNSGQLFVTLKSPSRARHYVTSQQVIDRLRPKFNAIAGARLFMVPMSSTGVRSGGRQSDASLQYTVQGDALSDLNVWVPKITDALQAVPQLEDVNSDQQDKGLEVDLKIDRGTASRLGLTASQIDNTLYDAFGQRQVSTIYKDKNQYHVIMEVAPEFWQSPETLRDIYVSTAGDINGTQSTANAGGDFSTTSAAAATSGSSAHRPRRSKLRCWPCKTSRSTASPPPAAAPVRPAHRSPPVWKRWCRCRPLSAMDPVPRRWRSTIRGPSLPPPSPSTCPRG